MANSPVSSRTENKANTSQAHYYRQLKRVDDLINRGGSLSGNERNCGFLNLGMSKNGVARFATISHVAGVDFHDDGRSYGLSDWDHDGDIDVWTMNRTAPRVRFLRNRQTSNNAFLGLRMIGTTANRDAIGARVEIHVVGNDGETFELQKTLRAGEGFLSQSSKWLHFGLGNADRVTKLTVDWPGGKRERFSQIAMNRFYDLRQNTGKAAIFEGPPPRDGRKVLANKNLPQASAQANVLLTSRIPFPRLSFRDENSIVSLQFDSHRATLINLWAHWCIPCRQELAELNRRSDDLTALGVRTIALSVDGLSNREGISNVEAIERANQVIDDFERSKFTMGFASKPMLQRLQFLDDFLFSQKRDIAIPTSFLVDGHGRLAAVFRGRLDVDTLVEMLSKIDLTGKALYDAAMPFPGFWFRPKQQGIPLELAVELRRSGYPNDAATYLLDHADQLVRRKGFGKLAGQLATSIADKQPRKAIELMRAALKQETTNIPIMNNLAWHLAKLRDPTPDELAEASKWAMAAAEATRFNSLPVLDTLASVQLRRALVSQAKTTLRHALKVADRQNDEKASTDIRRRLKSLNAK